MSLKKHMLSQPPGTVEAKALVEGYAHRLWSAGYSWYELPFDRYGHAHFHSCADLFITAAALYHLVGNDKQSEVCEGWVEKCQLRFNEDTYP